jgi:hypothetical protein
MLYSPLKLDISLPAREDAPWRTNYPGPDPGFWLPNILTLEVKKIKKIS